MSQFWGGSLEIFGTDSLKFVNGFVGDTSYLSLKTKNESLLVTLDFFEVEYIVVSCFII